MMFAIGFAFGALAMAVFAYLAHMKERNPMITITLSAKPTADEIKVGRAVLRVLEKSTLGEDLAMTAAAISAAAISADVPASVIPPPPLPSGVIPGGATVLDSQGMPWDERIHASTKNTNADGSWKKRRGVTDETVTRVETELRAAHGLPAMLPAAPPAPPPPVPPTETPLQTAVAASTSPTPPPPVTPAPPTGQDTRFPDLAKKVTQYMREGRIQQAGLVAAAQSIGLNNFPELHKNLDMIPMFEVALEAQLLPAAG